MKKKKKGISPSVRAAKWNVNKVAANPKNQLLPLKTAVPTIDFAASINSRAITELAIGWFSNAFSRGAVSRLEPADIWLAYQFFCSAVAASFSGQQYVSGNLPNWMRNMLQAFQPKIKATPSGRCSYTFSYSGTPPTPLISVPFGPNAWSYEYSWALPDLAATPINGFPVCSLFAPIAYTPQGGSTSFQKVCELMASSKPEDTSNVLVPSTAVTKYSKDVSSFAICSPEIGFGATNAGTNEPGGCFSHKVQLEVPINYPILACANYGSATDNRFPSMQVTFGGDPVFLTGALSSFISPSEMGMKLRPLYHCIDFMEFVDVMAQWVQGIQSSAVVEEAGINPASLQCPLTLQEMALLLRNIIMNAFKESQPSVQGLGPFKPSNNNDNYFMPFLCSPGTCPIATTAMSLPVPLIENIRCLVGRKIQFNPNNAGDSAHFIPILGKFVFDELDQEDYKYTSAADPPVTYPSFLSTAGRYRRRTGSVSKENGKPSYITLAETPIDYIDGNGGSQYIAINDPDRLTALTSFWNEWVGQSVVGSHSCQTSQWGTELGLSVLTSIDKTRHFNRQGGGEKKWATYQASLHEDVRYDMPRHQSKLAGPYALKNAVVDTSVTEFSSVPYEQVLSTWILPINLIAEVFSPVTQSTKLQRYQAFMFEKNSKSLTTSDIGILVSEQHAQYAAKMVKSRLSPATQWDEFFKEMEKLGRGGILSSLVGGLAKSLFPSASGIIDGISSVIPI